MTQATIDPRDEARGARQERLRPAVSTAHEIAVVLTVATVVLAVIDSQGLLAWARNLPEGPTADTVRLIAYGWHVLMERFGITEIFQTLRGTFRYLREF
ncbi:MAG: hypothetical protein HYU55_07815 [Nocardioides sp.]|nr:hypothetical protein [Nocardioides sp.]